MDSPDHSDGEEERRTGRLSSPFTSSDLTKIPEHKVSCNFKLDIKAKLKEKKFQKMEDFFFTVIEPATFRVQVNGLAPARSHCTGSLVIDKLCKSIECSD